MTPSRQNAPTCRAEASGEVWDPHDTVQFDALIAACALVAHVDGWVTAEERRSASARLHRVDATSVFGVARCLAAFDLMVSQFDQDSMVATERAEAAILRLAGKPDLARRVVEAACRVAIADRGLNHAERDAILDICQLLQVDPVPFGIVPPDGRR